MSSLVARVAGLLAALIVAVALGPSAYAMVPPEPGTRSAADALSTSDGFASFPWQTLAVALLAAVVGLALGMVIEHGRRRVGEPSASAA